MTPPDPATVAAGLTAAMAAVEQHCTDHVMDLIASHPGQHAIQATEQEWERGQDAFADRDAFYALMMPSERDAINVLNAAFNRLKALGWREAAYCPKDGSAFDSIEVGSTGIHSTTYIGDWPTGMWLVDGDWPARPVLYRPTEAEKAAAEESRKRFRAHQQQERQP